MEGGLGGRAPRASRAEAGVVIENAGSALTVVLAVLMSAASVRPQ
jgi:hypothetical protein